MNMKTEEICRTCLIDDGNFFNISHKFDQITLAQMIQDITNLQMNSSDGYTQSICFKCVAEVRKAHKFRRKCLQSNCTLIKLKTEPSTSKQIVELPDFICIKEEPREVENIKKESDDDDCNPADFLKTEYDEDQTSEVDSPTPENNSDDEDSESDKLNVKYVKREKKDYTIIDCPLCHGLFTSLNVLNEHLRNFHSDKINDINLAEKRQPLGYISKEKKGKNKFKLVYKCARKDFVGKNINELKNHVQEHMGDKPITCTDCDYRTTHVGLLKKHRFNKHSEEKKYFCNKCNYSCKTQGNLKAHSATHTSGKNIKCSLCSMTFKLATSLSRHKKVKHEQMKSHVCDICQKVFSYSISLKKHMLIHTGERPHICHHCGMTFTQLGNLTAHITVKHLPGTEIYKCDYCEYKTKLKAKLKVHIKIHFAEKNLQCPHCPYVSNSQACLKAHIWRHFNQEKKHSCDVCDYKCFTATRLKTHKLNHTGERPFPCNICSYSARSSHELKRHSETHNTELKYICHNCPYRTNTKELLLKHLRKQCVVKPRGRPSSKVLAANVVSIEMQNDDDKI